MPSSRQIISDFIRRGLIQPPQINEALTSTKVSPSIGSWFTFIDRLLLCLGALSVAFSVLFFIAYNWNDWGQVAKFTLIESLLIATVFLYWRAKKDSLTAQISLLVSCLMVGILMASHFKAVSAAWVTCFAGDACRRACSELVARSGWEQIPLALGGGGVKITLSRPLPVSAPTPFAWEWHAAKGAATNGEFEW